MAHILDKRYGIVGRKANLAVRELELKYRPKSIFKLSGKTSPSDKRIDDLNDFAKMDGIEVLENSFRLIWAVNREGEILVSFEELVSSSAGHINAVFNPNMDLRIGNDKLGHPSLINDKHARISGELYLDDANWVINNKSGRFGFIDDRREKHLQNVAEEFGKSGLSVITDFLPPN